MTFNYTVDHDTKFAAGQPVYAADLNSLLSDIETELNALGGAGGSAFAANSVTTAAIKDLAVTRPKIDLSEFTPTTAHHPAKVSWVNTQLDAAKEQMFGMGTIWVTDSTGNALSPDIMYQDDNYTEKVYKSQSDGLLIFVSHPKDATTRRILVWSGPSTVSGRGVGTMDISTLTFDWAVWDSDITDSGQDCVWDSAGTSAGQTAIVPIKNNNYFKVMAFKTKIGTGDGAAFDQIVHRMSFIGYGSGGAPVLQ